MHYSSPSSEINKKQSLLVSIETNQASTVIKEYDAHTVVLRVPPSISSDSVVRHGEDFDMTIANSYQSREDQANSRIDYDLIKR